MGVALRRRNSELASRFISFGAVLFLFCTRVLFASVEAR